MPAWLRTEAPTHPGFALESKGWQLLHLYQAQTEALLVDNGHCLHLRFDGRFLIEDGQRPLGQYKDFSTVVAQGITLELNQGNFGDLQDPTFDLYRFSFKTARALNDFSNWRESEW